MSLTLAQLRDTIRWVLKDKTIWRDTMVNGWIKDAIRDYSNYFPMEAVTTIDCLDATHDYALTSAGAVIGVLSVEYPDGEDPPRFLLRKGESTPGFYDQPFYDLRQGATQYLVIGESPFAAEDIILRYLTLHTNPSADSQPLTIPDEHAEALRLYVYWRALTSLAFDQSIELGRKSAMLAALGGTAKDAEYAYHYKMRSFQGPAPLTGVTSRWTMDLKDRIY